MNASHRAPLSAVFFDAGGTLLHEVPTRFEIYSQAARRHGLEVADGAMRRAMDDAHERLPREIDGRFRYSKAWFERFLENVFVDQLGLSRARLAAVQRELFERFEDPATFRLYPGAVELILSLRRRGWTLGVVSNWSEALPGILAGLGLADAFDVVVVSALERCEKPEPAIFERALARAGANPATTAHVGDDLERDVRGAQALGILAVHVDRRRDARAPTAITPDRTVNDLLELERWTRELPTI